MFLTMLFGAGGFGHALYAYHFVSHAAKSASRWAAVNGSTCASDNSCTAPATQSDIQNFVANNTAQGINSANITTTASWPTQYNGPTFCTTTQNAPGCTVKVEVSYHLTYIFPFISTIALTVSSSSQMIIMH